MIRVHLTGGSVFTGSAVGAEYGVRVLCEGVARPVQGDAARAWWRVALSRETSQAAISVVKRPSDAGGRTRRSSRAVTRALDMRG